MLNQKIIFVLTFMLLILANSFAQQKVIDKADKYYDKGDHMKVEEVLKEGLIKYPDNAIIIRALGNFYYRKKDYSTSKKYYLDVLKINEYDNYGVIERMGYIEYFFKNYEKSIAYLKKYTERFDNPIFPKIYMANAMWKSTLSESNEEYFSYIDKILEETVPRASVLKDFQKKYLYDLLVSRVYDFFLKVDEYYHSVDSEALKVLKKNLDLLMYFDFENNAKLNIPNKRRYYVYDTIKRRSKSERKVLVRDKSSQGQMELFLRIDNKIDKLSGNESYRKFKSEAVKLSPSIKRGNYGVLINASLNNSEIIKLMHLITSLDEYNKLYVVQKFKNDLSRFQGYDLNGPDDISIYRNANYINLKNDEFRNLAESNLGDKVNEFSDILGILVEAKFITMVVSPSNYELVDQKSEKKFHSGGLSGTSATYTESAIILKPNKLVTKSDLVRVGNIYNQVFDESYSLNTEILSQNQNLKLVTHTNIDDWTFKKGLAKVIKLLGESDSFENSDSRILGCFKTSNWKTIQHGFSFNAKKMTITCTKNSYRKDVTYIGDDKEYMVTSGIGHKRFKNLDDAITFAQENLSCNCSH